jgi:hypothetical protein
MADEPVDKQPQAGKLVPIEWPDVGVVMYANTLVTTADAHAVYLTFCQTIPPVMLGTVEEKLKQLADLKDIRAMPVARLAVPIEAFRGVVASLQEQIVNLDKMRAANAIANP